MPGWPGVDRGRDVRDSCRTASGAVRFAAASIDAFGRANDEREEAELLNGKSADNKGAFGGVLAQGLEQEQLGGLGGPAYDEVLPAVD